MHQFDVIMILIVYLKTTKQSISTPPLVFFILREFGISAKWILQALLVFNNKKRTALSRQGKQGSIFSLLKHEELTVVNAIDQSYSYV